MRGVYDFIFMHFCRPDVCILELLLGGEAVSRWLSHELAGTAIPAVGPNFFPSNLVSLHDREVRKCVGCD
jgi:hypothetical protein